MPNTLIEKLTNIKTAKENLKTALEGMGLNPGNDFSSYANFAQEQLQPAGGNGIKLFSTIEEMNADSNPHEGDLSIVYRSEIQNMTADMEVTSITFPETVTLPVAFTDNTYCRLRAVDSFIMFDGNCQLDQNSFRFDSWSESGMIGVEYTSTDGITYTRTRIQGDNGDLTNPVEIPTCKVEGEWNDNLGYFMQIGGMNFEGLFQYLNVDTNNQLTFNPSSLNISDTTINLVQAGPILNYEILKSAVKYLSQFYTDSEFQFDAYIDYDNKVHIIYAKSGYNSLIRMFIVNKNSPEIYMGPNRSTVAEHFDAIYDDVDKTFKNEQSIAFTTMFKNVSSSGFSCVKINGYPICPIGIQQNNYDEWRHFNSTIYYLDTIDSNTNINITDGKLKLNEMVIKYLPAPTQLSAISGYVYEKEFYGKNGIEIGTLGAPDNSFADINAEIYNRIQNQYKTMEPRVLTDDDKTIDKNIYFIPTKNDGTPLLDISRVTNMRSMFYNCDNLINIPQLNTDNVTNMFSAFENCNNLKEIAQLNTNKVTNMRYMFRFCVNLVIAPQINTGNVTDIDFMFGNCTNLVTVPLLDISKVTSIENMFYDCPNLSDESLNNILAMCANATAYIAQGTNMTLAHIGLTSTQATRCQSLSNYQAFLNAGWTTGY